MKNQDKTMLCVAIAGLIFIPSVLWGVKWPIVVGAFFDWLPLPTGWMKAGGEPSKTTKTWVFIHVVLTLVAYAFAILWLAGVWNSIMVRFLFIEIWWLAVMAGVKLTSSYKR